MYYFCTSKKPIVPWCNGSTADFGSAGSGSSPGGTTKKVIELLRFNDFFVLIHAVNLLWCY